MYMKLSLSLSHTPEAVEKYSQARHSRGCRDIWTWPLPPYSFPHCPSLGLLSPVSLVLWEKILTNALKVLNFNLAHLHLTPHCFGLSPSKIFWYVYHHLHPRKVFCTKYQSYLDQTSNQPFFLSLVVKEASRWCLRVNCSRIFLDVLFSLEKILRSASPMVGLALGSNWEVDILAGFFN